MFSFVITGTIGMVAWKLIEAHESFNPKGKSSFFRMKTVHATKKKESRRSISNGDLVDSGSEEEESLPEEEDYELGQLQVLQLKTDAFHRIRLNMIVLFGLLFFVMILCFLFWLQLLLPYRSMLFPHNDLEVAFVGSVSQSSVSI
jgi:hypothetical protein